MTLTVPDPDDRSPCSCSDQPPALDYVRPADLGLTIAEARSRFRGVVEYGPNADPFYSVEDLTAAGVL